MNTRPNNFVSFHGQQAAVQQLQVAVRAALKQKRPLGHVLLVGPPGVGKTTLGAGVVPTELNAEIKQVNCSSLEKPQDLLPTLTTMAPGSVLFLDEIHALPRQLAENLYTVMEDSFLTVVVGDEPNTQVIRLDLERFTIIGATTREGLIPEPMRDRFKHIVRLDLYSDVEMAQVLGWIVEQVGCERGFNRFAIEALLPACHGTARHAVRLVEACLETLDGDPAFEGQVLLTRDVVEATLRRLGYGPNGLTKPEIQLMRRLKTSPNRTAGLSTLAAVLEEEAETVEDVYEPFLLRAGYVIRTPQGRQLTDAGDAALSQSDWP